MKHAPTREWTEMAIASQTGTDIGERLFWCRDARGWSQSELARQAGISRTTVVVTEIGKTKPRLPTLRRLARAFGVTVDELVSGPLPEKKT